MTTKVVELDQVRRKRTAEAHAAVWAALADLPSHFAAAHCAPARAMLGWSVEALAFRSGVSINAIKDLELGVRALRRVTMQALSYSLEEEGLIFLPNNPPMRGANCRGGTTDPKSRSDYHLLE